MASPLDSEREKSLVERARQEPAAFRQLYRHYLPKIHAYMSYRVAAENVEDLVADVFLSALSGLENFEYRGKGSFAAWLFGIARNLVHSSYRREAMHGRFNPLSLGEDADRRPEMPEEILVQVERVQQMRRLLDTLSRRQQEVIRLRFFAGLQNKEIAGLLELDERTVASYLYRGLQELHRRFLKETILADSEVSDGGVDESRS
jgi:RNA polymerase sigma-70 factor (ECF subfamily)